MNIQTGISVIPVLFLLSISIQVGHAGGMTEEQMQQMMQQAEEMQKCFAKIDPSAMKKLETRGRAMDAEVRALCKSGKRDDAQKAAMKYAKEISSSRELQAMKKCGKMAENMMTQMSMLSPDEITKSGHICDNM
ncbi:MAG: hypothetical protein R3318_03135 [Gammaproteobacteria bacterium]|nr:hypothetical protein [Gammaproteobacteria bacterium]